MHGNYEYIIRKLGEPLYYDVYGAPHYEIHVSDIWDFKSWKNFEKFLRVVICQGCGKNMVVQCTHPVYSSDRTYDTRKHYGDPPHHSKGDEYCVGNSMNVDDTRELTKEELRKFLGKAISLEEQIENRVLIKSIIKQLQVQ